MTGWAELPVAMRKYFLVGPVSTSIGIGAHYRPQRGGSALA